ncbi:hypothetical protein BpHYR1_004804 [Brachionus plicatilis]|uniref:SWIM-type domain-containing protein n=1 Tax=Brachionus plicatilis TaxID=10195 RepID=A0A3M7PVZ9_BRAPC|nr:hypothetical protein BpHYR1_004804 [Brachionus plicatilis]
MQKKCMVNNLILNEDSYMEKKLGKEAELYICELISSSYVYYINKINEKKLVEDANNWKRSSSNCECFHNDYICKHIILLTIRFKYRQVPLTAPTLMLG